MSAPHATQIVDGYFAQLELALAPADPARRAELLDDVREHVREARAALTEETDADLFAIVDRLGPPATLAAELDGSGSASASGRVEPGVPSAGGERWGPLEAAALIFTFFAWPFGVLLAWLSRTWDRREKLVATLIGGIAFLLGFPLLAPIVGPVLAPLVSSLGPAAPAVMGTIGTLPLVSAIYLGVRLARRGATFALTLP